LQALIDRNNLKPFLHGKTNILVEPKIHKSTPHKLSRVGEPLTLTLKGTPGPIESPKMRTKVVSRKSTSKQPRPEKPQEALKIINDNPSPPKQPIAESVETT